MDCNQLRKMVKQHYPEGMPRKGNALEEVDQALDGMDSTYDLAVSECKHKFEVFDHILSQCPSNSRVLTAP